MAASSAHLDRTACSNLDRTLATEWLETDGVGGFASSTVLGCPTRRYHGLLVTPPPGSARRHLFLARFDEVVRVGGGPPTPFAVARYANGELAPQDAVGIVQEFALCPHPRTRLRVGDLELIREVVQPKRQPTVLCRYELRGVTGAVLELRPLLACREADALTFQNDVLDPAVETVPGGIRCRPYASLPPVTITFAANGSDVEFEPDPVWYRGLLYTVERERGYDAIEDQWSPGVLRVRLGDGGACVVAATIGAAIEAPIALFERTVEQRRAPSRRGGARDSAVRARLERTAGDFLYDAEGPAGRRLGITAGFPWFVEWGRDTFLSLPGLTLARGHLDQCGAVLDGVLEFVRDGLVPNVFGTTPDDSHYGSVDAALWFARAVELWAAAGGDRTALIERYRPALEEIATRYLDGTGLEVAADDGLLIHAGNPELNATWMDAQTFDGPVTPRHGCAVEIQALWYALLDLCAELADESGDAAAHAAWRARRDRAGASFVTRLWLPDDGYLADRWVEGQPERRIRPNMVIAAALSRSPLTTAMRVAVVDRAERDLLTPCGLRTLAPTDPDYVGRYGGDQDTRDRAYHQGTVWPWLLGFYVEAALRARGARAVKPLRRLLDGLEPQLDRHGLDHVSEVFDGDAPHAAGGSIAQAWSTAEVLRAYALLDEPPAPKPA